MKTLFLIVLVFFALSVQGQPRNGPYGPGGGGGGGGISAANALNISQTNNTINPLGGTQNINGSVLLATNANTANGVTIDYPNVPNIPFGMSLGTSGIRLGGYLQQDAAQNFIQYPQGPDMMGGFSEDVSVGWLLNNAAQGVNSLILQYAIGVMNNGLATNSIFPSGDITWQYNSYGQSQNMQWSNVTGIAFQPLNTVFIYSKTTNSTYPGPYFANTNAVAEGWSGDTTWSLGPVNNLIPINDPTYLVTYYWQGYIDTNLAVNFAATGGNGAQYTGFSFTNTTTLGGEQVQEIGLVNTNTIYATNTINGYKNIAFTNNMSSPMVYMSVSDNTKYGSNVAGVGFVWGPVSALPWTNVSATPNSPIGPPGTWKNGSGITANAEFYLIVTNLNTAFSGSSAGIGLSVATITGWFTGGTVSTFWTNTAPGAGMVSVSIQNTNTATVILSNMTSHASLTFSGSSILNSTNDSSASMLVASNDIVIVTNVVAPSATVGFRLISSQFQKIY